MALWQVQRVNFTNTLLDINDLVSGALLKWSSHGTVLPRAYGWEQKGKCCSKVVECICVENKRKKQKEPAHDIFPSSSGKVLPWLQPQCHWHYLWTLQKDMAALLFHPPVTRQPLRTVLRTLKLCWWSDSLHRSLPRCLPHMAAVGNINTTCKPIWRVKKNHSDKPLAQI